MGHHLVPGKTILITSINLWKSVQLITRRSAEIKPRCHRQKFDLKQLHSTYPTLKSYSIRVCLIMGYSISMGNLGIQRCMSELVPCLQTLRDVARGTPGSHERGIHGHRHCAIKRWWMVDAGGWSGWSTVAFMGRLDDPLALSPMPWESRSIHFGWRRRHTWAQASSISSPATWLKDWHSCRCRV